MSGLHNLLTPNLIFTPQNIYSLSSTLACNAVLNSLCKAFFDVFSFLVRYLCAQGTSAVSNPTLHLDKKDLPQSPSKFNQKGLSNSFFPGSKNIF